MDEEITYELITDEQVEMLIALSKRIPGSSQTAMVAEINGRRLIKGYRITKFAHLREVDFDYIYGIFSYRADLLG